jgi:AcrR family transcriptional regulator
MARTRRPAAERREQIALAALRLLGEGGRKSVTTATLAAEVSVTTGALFRHFPTIDDVLDEVARIAVRRVRETFPPENPDPLERLLQLARNRVKLLGGDPGIAWLLRSEQAPAQLPPAALQALQEVVRDSRRFILGELKRGMAQGSIRDDVGAAELLIIVSGTIHTLVGVAGVHGGGTRPRPPSTTKALDGLRKVLSPTPVRRRRSPARSPARSRTA